MQYKTYTQNEAEYMINNHRFENRNGLRDLINWNKPDFRDMILGFIKSMGYSNLKEERQKDAEIKRYDENNKKGEDRANYERLLNAEIPVRFYDTEKYKQSYWQDGLNTFVGFMQKWRNKDVPNLYVHGLSYTGKSHLVAYGLNGFVKKGVNVYWVNVPEFFNMCNDDGFKEEIHKRKIRMMTTSILVLDDIFKRSFYKVGNKQVTGAASILYSIIEKRLGNKSTIYIDEKNLQDETIKEGVSEAVINRIKDNAIILKSGGKYIP